MADQTIIIDVSQSLAEIAKLKGGLADAQAQTAKTQATFGGFSTDLNSVLTKNAKAAAAAVTELKKSIEASSTAAKENEKATKKLSDESKGLTAAQKDARARMDEGIKAFYAEKAAAESSATSKNKAAASTEKLSLSQRALNLIMKASPIGLIIAAFGAIVAALVRLQPVVDKVNQVFAAMNAIIGVIADRLSFLGDAISSLFQGDFAAAGQSLSNTFDGLATSIGSSVSKAVELEKQFQQLTKSMLDSEVSTARQVAKLEKLKEAIDDETLSVNARMIAAKQAAALEEKLNNEKTQREKDLLENLEDRKLIQSAILEDMVRTGASAAEIEKQQLLAAQERKNLSNETQKELNDGELKLIETQSEADKSRLEYQRKIREINKQAADEAKRAAAETKKTADELRALIERLNVATQEDDLSGQIATVNKKYNDLAKAASDGLEKLAEIESKKGLSDTQAEQQRQLTGFLIKIEEKRGAALVDVLVAANEKQAEIENEQIERRAALAQREYNDRLKEIEAIRDLGGQRVDIMETTGKGAIEVLKANGASEKQIKAAELALDIETQKARLQNELEFQLALLDTVNNGDEKRIQEVLNNIDLIRGKIANLDIGAAGGEKKSLLERLGFTDNEIKDLDKAAREVIGILQDITAANVQQAEEKLRVAQEAVSEAEEALEKEIELKEDGFASDVDLREKELQKAKDDEARALAQKRAAQRAQLALDSAMQLSSLVTSASNIIKGFSAIPFVGTALGIAAVAAMFAAFATVKARAFSATKLKHGGQGKVDGNSIIMGASHDGGGVGIEAEGGEFFGTDGKRFGVVNKRMTAKHFDLLDAINRDDRGAMAAALSHLTTGLDMGAVSRSVSMSGGSHVSDRGGDLYGLVSDWRNESRSRPSVTIEGAYRVERRGSTTKKVKIR